MFNIAVYFLLLVSYDCLAPSNKLTAAPSVSISTKAPTVKPSIKTLSPSPVPTFKPSMFYLGSYNPDNTISRWVYNVNQSVTFIGAYKLDRHLGMSPSWIKFSPDKKYLYAVNEYQNLVSSYSVDGMSGTLTLINTVSSGGRGGMYLILLNIILLFCLQSGRSPCHMSVDGLNRFLLVANYFGGIVAQIPISSVGVLSPPSSIISHLPATASNIHGVYNFGGFATVMDKGLDIVRQYAISTSGVLSVNASVTIKVPIGTGPNHLGLALT